MLKRQKHSPKKLEANKKTTEIEKTKTVAFIQLKQRINVINVPSENISQQTMRKVLKHPAKEPLPSNVLNWNILGIWSFENAVTSV